MSEDLVSDPIYEKYQEVIPLGKNILCGIENNQPLKTKGGIILAETSKLEGVRPIFLVVRAVGDDVTPKIQVGDVIQTPGGQYGAFLGKQGEKLCILPEASVVGVYKPL